MWRPGVMWEWAAPEISANDLFNDPDNQKFE